MVSIIVPTTTGGLNHLVKLMPSLEAVKTPHETIIIDNNSHDGTLNYLSNYECTIKVNKAPKNFSASNNQGARIAQGEYLLLLNNDTYVTDSFLDKMLSTFQKGDNIGIVGALLWKMGQNKVVQHAGVYFNSDYIPYELGMCNPSVPKISIQDERIRSIREVPSVTAACMLIKREVWDAVGGMDEGYQVGWEDTDFVLKAREKGYKVWYNGSAEVYHFHFGSQTAGRFKFEGQNRTRYDSIWVHSGRAKQIIENTYVTSE